MKFWTISFTVVACLLVSVFASATDDTPHPSYEVFAREAYRELDRVRDQRRGQLEAYCERLQSLARKVREDEALKGFFQIWHDYVGMVREVKPPRKTVAAMAGLVESIRDHYLHHYLAFYDILFVDRQGRVFFSIRRESDLGKNVFFGPLKDTTLSRHLREKPEESFVDFEYYPVSREPSAFFVEAVEVDGEVVGWFVLQCAINKINEIFSREPGLGDTGEVFLVNRDQEMLTQSRFTRDSSILRQHLSEENVRRKFSEGQGQMAVLDYRGFPVISSFSVCDVINSQWLIIAKRDADEVLTEYYREERNEWEAPLREAAVDAAVSFVGADSAGTGEGLRVDIDEFRKGKGGESLLTWGVSTCTAIVMHMPGKFAYMGHASSYDTIYGEGSLDLVGHMLGRIERFDIYPYEKRELEIIVVAPHLNSFSHTVKKLTEAGLLLSQIRFMVNPDAHSAAVRHEVDSGTTWIEWQDAEGSLIGEGVQRAKDAPTLGDSFLALVKRVD